MDANVIAYGDDPRQHDGAAEKLITLLDQQPEGYKFSGIRKFV